MRALAVHPIVSSDCKRELSKRHALPALSVEVDINPYFPELLLAGAAVEWLAANVLARRFGQPAAPATIAGPFFQAT